MTKVYINGISSVSPQSDKIFEDSEIKHYSENILPALDQEYKAYIKPMMLRRMSKAVKMGLFCSKKALEEAKIKVPDAILVGSGQGCMQDTEKFMSNMLNNQEDLLSPTSFIQSTHNTVGGQIALNLKCTGYNMTYTQNSVSFESALLDSILQIMTEGDSENILVGGVDETSKVFTGFQKLDGQVKTENIDNLDLFNSESTGTIISESAAFFVLSSHQSADSYAEIEGVNILNAVDPTNLDSKIESFLKDNETDISEIDVVILGNNGDSRFDHYYKDLQKGIFSNTCQLGFKHLVGDNNSVSSYALWMAAKILKEKQVPSIFKMNGLNCSNPAKILIYNQYIGRNHGLILLESL